MWGFGWRFPSSSVVLLSRVQVAWAKMLPRGSRSASSGQKLNRLSREEGYLATQKRGPELTAFSEGSGLDCIFSAIEDNTSL